MFEVPKGNAVVLASRAKGCCEMIAARAVGNERTTIMIVQNKVQ